MDSEKTPRALTSVPVRSLALATGLLPIVAVHLTYIVSAAEGHVPWCFPYVDSCASISATGRHGIAFFLFKGTMIPAAMLLMAYWHVSGKWLLLLGDSRAQANLVVTIGVIAAVFLIVYTVALGAAGDALRLQRRIGIIVYFAFTYLSQLLLVWRIGKVAPTEPTRRWLLGLCVAALFIGLSTLVLDAAIDNYEDYEDAFEWVLALLIHLYFLVTWRSWSHAGLALRFSSESRR